jgi:hypothetical protein
MSDFQVDCSIESHEKQSMPSSRGLPVLYAAEGKLRYVVASERKRSKAAQGLEQTDGAPATST